MEEKATTERENHDSGIASVSDLLVSPSKSWTSFSELFHKLNLPPALVKP